MKILNFGSCNIDYVYEVENFVRAGETLSALSTSEHPGGKVLNQAVAAASSIPKIEDKRKSVLVRGGFLLITSYLFTLTSQ